MRLVGLIVCLLSLAASASGATMDKRPTAGLFSVESGRGKIVLTGSGVLVGRLDSGQLEIKDLTPSDRFSPRVLGVPRGKMVRLRGKDVGFYVPGGRYRIVVRGEGISLSARGTGIAVLDGEPDTVGATGSFAVDDAPATPLPDEPTRVPFGKLPDDPSIDPNTGGATVGGTRPTP
jgi:hypothetical protein